jgi:hypothetical protein
MQTYQLEADAQGIVYARVYVDGQRTSALTYEIPTDLSEQAQRQQEIEDSKPF